MHFRLNRHSSCHTKTLAASPHESFPVSDTPCRLQVRCSHASRHGYAYFTVYRQRNRTPGLRSRKQSTKEKFRAWMTSDLQLLHSRAFLALPFCATLPTPRPPCLSAACMVSDLPSSTTDPWLFPSVPKSESLELMKHSVK